MVDEFQDTNALQMRLIVLLHKTEKGKGSPNQLFIVGDAQQSIYGFRGADSKLFRDLEHDKTLPTFGDHFMTCLMLGTAERVNLKKMYPGITDSNIKFAGVAKAKHVITVAKLGYSLNLPNVKTSVPGVYIINTSHIKDGTLNVNETITVAETKLKEILT